MTANITRREMLRSLAATSLVSCAPGAAAAERPATAPIADRKVRIAIIGAGDRGMLFLRQSLAMGGVEVAALCDIDPRAARRGADAVKEKTGGDPPVYTEGPQDYRRLLRRDDVDAVFITTPAPCHGAMAVDSLRAKKWVFSEVPAVNTIDECWALVRAAEETGAGYFLAENYCFTRANLLVLNLVEKGLLGELTFAECGYIHDCRDIAFDAGGAPTWRGKENSDPAYRGNSYPTHSLGPVSQWLGITRGDRFTTAVSLDSRPAARHLYAVKRFGPSSPAAAIDSWNGDTVQSLLRTESGALVSVRFDSASPRPHRMGMFTLQGTEGSYDDERGIYLEGSSPGWEPLAKHQDAHDHPFWRRHGAEAEKAGHQGGDFFTLLHFYDCLRRGRAPGIDVHDAVTWSALIELSRRSILAGGAPQEFPDFTAGKWKTRKRHDWSSI